MSDTLWQPQWLHGEACHLAEPRVWRGVETQYASATTVLVDTFDEHDVLEALLEDSKPPAPARARGKHFLLMTPFRYTPLHGSRFRKAGQHGVWYGAKRLETACAEVAYWRTRFLADSAGLRGRRIVTRHTFFAAAVSGPGIDLTVPPWVASRRAWIGDDYHHTQCLAQAADRAGITVIRYESARAPHQHSLAVLTPDALAEPRGGLDRTRQQWTCTATDRQAMMMAQQDQTLRFEWPP